MLFSDPMPFSSVYSDRLRPPSETLKVVSPYFRHFGVTRLARQTGLDTIGIPVWAAIRPNSRSIAVNQGKGISDEDAKASAAMEAIEFAVAEDPSAETFLATQAELEQRDCDVFDPHRLLPPNEVASRNQPFEWLRGENLSTRQPVYVHRSVCTLNGRPDLPGVCQNTNGLASGNCLAEALFHGLCELIERDAQTLWAFADSAERLGRSISPSSFADPVVSDLVARIRESGAELRLFLLTRDIDVCTVHAIIRQRVQRSDIFKFASGSGCHPVPSRAAIRAITEAAQSKVTAIVATRDDIHPSEYRRRANDDLDILFSADEAHQEIYGLPLGTPLPELLDYAAQQALSQGCSDIVAVELGSKELPFAVVRVLSTSLEDWDVNRNWRPGLRLLMAAA